MAYIYYILLIMGLILLGRTTKLARAGRLPFKYAAVFMLISVVVVLFSMGGVVFAR